MLCLQLFTANASVLPRCSLEPKGLLQGVPPSSCGSCSYVEFDIRLLEALGGQVLSRDCLGPLSLKGEISGEKCVDSFAACGLRDNVRGHHCDERVSCVMSLV